MNTPEYTLVVGVDAFHLRQLGLSWPTWKRHKPSLLGKPMVVFYDKSSTNNEQVKLVIDHPNLRTVPWPLCDIEWDREKGKKGEKGDKFQDPHRAMMLSGFVYVPAAFVSTPYWLKLDTDVVATDMDDWIDSSWFNGDPAIIAHRWSFTKPADQMLKLDRWVEENPDSMPKEFANKKPLNLVPNLGWDRLSHPRIISWCGLFDTIWTHRMAMTSQLSNGVFQLPVSSQDGFLWFMATRGGRQIIRANMKARGWQHWSTWSNVKKHAEEAMK